MKLEETQERVGSGVGRLEQARDGGGVVRSTRRDAKRDRRGYGSPAIHNFVETRERGETE